MNAKLTNLIGQKRRELNLSIEDLASKVGCTPTELRGFEHGVISVRGYVLHALVTTLEIDAAEISAILGEQASDLLAQSTKFQQTKTSTLSTKNQFN